VIASFGDKTTEYIFVGKNSTDARKIPQDIWPIARRKLDMINAATDLNDLRVPPANRLKRLKGKLKRFHCIRVNDQYRVIFVWASRNAHEVQVLDYHD
jgi:toxin HigB-1